MRDVIVELKALRLHGMAGAWCDLQEQGPASGLDASRWLVEHHVDRIDDMKAFDSAGYSVVADDSDAARWMFRRA